jgi:DNA polymerase
VSLLTIDFETYYDQEYSLSKLTTEQYVRDSKFEVIGVSVKVDDGEPVWFSGTFEETDAFLASYEMHKHMVLCHNTAFDGFILHEKFGITAGFYLDTMSMAKPLYGMEVGMSLDALTYHLGLGKKGHEVHDAKGKRRADFTPDELAAYGGYCSNDVELTCKLFHAMKAQIPQAELQIIDMMLRMFICPAIELDKPRLQNHLAAVKAEKEVLLNQAGGEALRPILASNLKFAKFLTEHNVPVPTKISPTTGKTTNALGKKDEGMLALLEHPDPFIQAVVAARMGVKSTLDETRTAALIDLADRGTMPVYLRYYGAHTGRASGGEKLNPQNNKRGGEIRNCMVAPEGHVFVVGDSAQIEARGLGWFAGQDDLVQDFADGVDVYSKFASSVYGREINKNDDPIERFVGKTGILGLGYGVGTDKFVATLATSSPAVLMEWSDGQNVVNTYRTKYDKIVTLWKIADTVIKCMHEGTTFSFGPDLPGGGKVLTTGKNCIYLPNGMQLRYPNLHKNKDGWVYTSTRKQVTSYVMAQLKDEPCDGKLTHLYGAKLVENIIQALARIVVFDQMLALHRQGYRVVLTVHDEIVLLCKATIAEAVKDIMLGVMKTSPVWAKGLPLSSEVGVGRTYGDAK